MITKYIKVHTDATKVMSRLKRHVLEIVIDVNAA